ncbi:TIGR02444 family protein [Gallaecimonas kandeliae]|uniref:TIGR02444 family protein n=1 Tax=Gallaecimonas kandeliae TaxID=3029055 RepID=UPI0026473EB7|nr:TIGR02444 family protein [Gallaecimonas kandeliae]WKE65191.1 TIGR02444 family protein [Gallaecimonas kandeliae]
MSETFWDYCLLHYPQWEQQLLAWQDSHELDVNLYLLAAWLDEEELFLEQATWLALLAESRRIQAQWLGPFRALRLSLKAEVGEERYQELKTMELRLEKEAQRQYQALVGRDKSAQDYPQNKAAGPKNLPRLKALYQLP